MQDVPQLCGRHLLGAELRHGVRPFGRHLRLPGVAGDRREQRAGRVSARSALEVTTAVVDLGDPGELLVAVVVVNRDVAVVAVRRELDVEVEGDLLERVDDRHRVLHRAALPDRGRQAFAGGGDTDEVLFVDVVAATGCDDGCGYAETCDRGAEDRSVRLCTIHSGAPLSFGACGARRR